MKLSEKLDKYQHIGIDFDGTLIDSSKSYIIAKYILNNPNKKYYIITFRTHGMERNIIKDLLQFYGASLGNNINNYITNVFTLPYKDYEDYTVSKVNTRLSKEEIVKMQYNYLHFKGKICSENNIEVLIDDLPNDVIQGCNLYNIDYVDVFDISSL